MASNTSRIIVLETQMAAIKQQMDSRHRDLKAAIAALADSTKASIDALTDSLEQRRDVSRVRSPWHASPNQFADPQPFIPPPRQSLILDPHVWVPSSTVSGQLASIADHQVPSPTFNLVSPLSTSAPKSLIPSAVSSPRIQDPNPSSPEPPPFALPSFPPSFALLPSTPSVVVYPIDSFATPVASSTSNPSHPFPHSSAAIKEIKIETPKSFPPTLLSSFFLPSPPQTISTLKIHSLPNWDIHTSFTGDPNDICAQKIESSVSRGASSISGSCDNFAIRVFPTVFSSGFQDCHIPLMHSKLNYGVRICCGYGGNCVAPTRREKYPLFMVPFVGCNMAIFNSSVQYGFQIFPTYYGVHLNSHTGCTYADFKGPYKDYEEHVDGVEHVKRKQNCGLSERDNGLFVESSEPVKDWVSRVRREGVHCAAGEGCAKVSQQGNVANKNAGSISIVENERTLAATKLAKERVDHTDLTFFAYFLWNYSTVIKFVKPQERHYNSHISTGLRELQRHFYSGSIEQLPLKKRIMFLKI
ncbi:unnamed protein product [Linum trigynum]|uniref:Uncharacterized protein n=1 Tax=Linum trigynum TaxID=586398 RepID=A0AAV2DWN8_9ROSI